MIPIGRSGRPTPKAGGAGACLKWRKLPQVEFLRQRRGRMFFSYVANFDQALFLWGDRTAIKRRTRCVSSLRQRASGEERKAEIRIDSLPYAAVPGWTRGFHDSGFDEVDSGSQAGHRRTPRSQPLHQRTDGLQGEACQQEGENPTTEGVEGTRLSVASVQASQEALDESVLNDEICAL